MRKNRLMRLASVLLVLTLLTTSVIGGTFAKYVTTDKATDTARVAKWGIVASVSGDLFGSAYAAADDNTIVAHSTSGATVNAEEATEGATVARIVAPGTNNLNKGMTISVTGKAEVKSKMTVGTPTGFTNSDIFLAVGDYGVMVEYTGEKTKDNITNYYVLADGTYTKATVPEVGADDPKTVDQKVNEMQVYELVDEATVETSQPYYPLKWAVNNDSPSLNGANALATVGTNVVNAIKADGTEKTVDDKTYYEFATNYDFSNTHSAKITWVWDFTDSTNGTITARDKKDTILGDMIAAQLDSTNHKPAVVKKGTDNKYVTVSYKEFDNGDGTDKIVVAYTGTTAPSTVDADTVCACLTAAFGVQLTVEQVN